MDRAPKETNVTQRFAERDLRAKVATDAEASEGLERVRKLLGHMRRAEVVRWLAHYRFNSA